jgi:uncharacterized protein (TIGR02246 family)
VDELASESAIRALVANYCHGIDKRDRDRFLSIWHPDAEWLGGPSGDCHGIDEIARALEEKIWPGAAETHHWTSNLVIELDGDRASGMCDADVTVISPRGTPLMVAATYRDACERRAGTWRIRRREMVVHYTGKLAGLELRRMTR